MMDVYEKVTEAIDNGRHTLDVECMSSSSELILKAADLFLKAEIIATLNEIKGQLTCLKMLEHIECKL